MDVVLFRELQQAFRTEGLLYVSDAKGWTTVAVEAAVFGLIAWGLSLVQPGSWGFIALELLAGLSVFRWFVILHECGHKTLFRPLSVNTIIGHVASVFCLIPYFAWRNVHALHHRWVGVLDKDPTQRDLLKLRRASPAQMLMFRLVWKLWLPIPFAKFLFEVFWGYPLDRMRAGAYRNMWLGTYSNLLCLGVHGALIAILGLSRWALYYFPMLAVFYFVIENMNLPQHSELFPYTSDTHPNPIPFTEQDAITRSTHLPDWLGVVLALNFNRHTEHHLFPAVPWYALNLLRGRLLKAGYRHPYEVPFLAFMWRFRRRDPVTIYCDSLPFQKDGI